MELLRALGAYCEQPAAGVHDQARPAASALADALGLPVATPREWHATFVERYHPYASVHLSDTGFLGGAVRAATAGLLRALDADPPEDADHLTTLLDALATADGHGWAPARSALLWEHILPWTVPYLDRISTDAPACYRDWAALTLQVLSDLAGRVAPPDPLAPILVHAPSGLADPRSTAPAAFLESLLATARLGTVLTRDDLHRAAGDLGIAARVGERRYVLKALLAQDASGVLGWLGRHVESAADRTDAWPPTVRVVAEAWAGRARASADLLTDLTTDASRAGAA